MRASISFLIAALRVASAAGLGATHGGEAGSDPSQAKTLFEEKCSLCHKLDRPLSTRRTAEQWTATVNRMAAKTPEFISDSEAQSITIYLARTRAASASESDTALPAWVTPALGAATWIVALATMGAGLLRKRLGRAFQLHKYGALAAAILWGLHLASMPLH